MITLNERYRVDAQGQRLGVWLDLVDYQKVRAALAELEFLHDPLKFLNPDVQLKTCSTRYRGTTNLCSGGTTRPSEVN
jgi:hypothetical protein